MMALTILRPSALYSPPSQTRFSSSSSSRLFLPSIFPRNSTPCSASSLFLPRRPLSLSFATASGSSRRKVAASSGAGSGGDPNPLAPPMPLSDDLLVHDVGVAVLASSVALLLLRFWAEMANRNVFDQKLNRKLVHISAGLVFMLFWPMFSSQREAAFLAAVAPGVNIIRMLLLGLGIWRNDAMVKSISRHGDYRELLKGPLYYACTLTLATSIFWRSSPIAIAAICNLCAGDGVADIIGRRFGAQKLPYNYSKSVAGSIAMVVAGFIASVWYMHYFSLFGLMEESWGLVIRFLVVSLATAVVESLPISTELDDNLTVPLTALVVGGIIF